MKPKGLAELMALQTELDKQEHVQAIYSSHEVGAVLNLVDTGARLMRLSTASSVALAGIAILLAFLASSTERRKDIGLMRLLGKSRGFLVAGLMLESLLLTSFGAIAGLCLGHIGCWVLQESIFRYAGIQLQTWTFYRQEWMILAGALLLGVLASLWPVLRAYRVQPFELFRS